MEKEIKNVDWIYHTEYFKIARDKYGEIEKLKQEHDSFQKRLKHKKKILDVEVGFLAEKNDLIGQYAIIAIIFSALSLEAYINHYAITKLSKNYLKDYLDKLDLLSKWIIIPRIVTGKQLDPGLTPVQDLSWLITLRNKMAHYKSREIEIANIKESYFFWEHDARKAIKTVRNIVLALKEIDKDIDIWWIE